MANAIVEFYPTDISYTDEGEKASIKIYGLTDDRKKVIVKQGSFEPYFYAKTDIDMRNVTKGIYKVTRVEEVEKKILRKKVKLKKIYVNNPKGIKEISKKCCEIDAKCKNYEYDIPYVKRYLIDNELSFLTKLRATGEVISSKEELNINAKSIQKVEEKYLSNPRWVAFDIETYNKEGYSLPEKDPIIMISMYFSDGKVKLLTTKRINEKYVETLDNEGDMLRRFNDLLKSDAPDFVVGYNSDLFDFPYILKRAKKHKIRLDFGWENTAPKRVRRGRNFCVKIKGITHIDMYSFIMRILGPNLKTEVYGLNAVSEELLGEKKDDIEMENMWEHWDKEEGMEALANYCVKDAILAGKLFENLYFQLTEISKMCGLNLFDVCRAGYSQFVDLYLMMSMSKLGEIIPEKPRREQTKMRLGMTYAGAFVYEPKPGLYQNVAVFDFKSLYPSIIINHNISPDTLNRGRYHQTPLINGNVYKFPQKPIGLIPSLMKTLLDRRSRIKEMMKSIDEKKKDYKILNGRQYALKIIANAMYGYLGFPMSRWYSIECARSITAYGRKYIMGTIELAEKMDYKVLYGDTDSIFLVLSGKEACNDFAKKVNKLLPELIDLQFEGFYPAGLFVGKKSEKRGAKKKYALLTEEGNIEVKGFAYVRRDWSDIAKKCQIEVIETMLKKQDVERAGRIVEEIVKKLRNHEIPLEAVVIHTTLQKKLSEYKAIGPHVAAAKRAKNLGYPISEGAILKYVIVEGGGSISSRARIYDEAKKNRMRYDAEYYLNNQIIPAVEQILDVKGLNRQEKKLEKFF